MEIRLLGPIEARTAQGPVALPRRQQRALLAALALRAGEVVATDRLVADLWGERAPTSALGSLQNTISALRKLLGRDVVVTQPPGYRLAVPREAVDANRFEQRVTGARGADPAERARLLRDALGLWNGSALAGLDEDFARLEAARLDELRLTAIEERIEAELELGLHAALVAELEQHVAAHPLRERPRAQLMTALYRCGRHAEALEVYRAARLALADELGLDPSAELQELERRVLRQDPSLAAPAGADEQGEAAAPAERRLVTVLAALPPSDEDPERHRALLDETLASTRDALARHGGVLERFGPEGLVAVFGADGPEDDDAERAVAAARELGLAAGVATGEVVEGAGAVFTRAVELARDGGVRLDERTAALVRASRRPDAPLVGRGRELARLLDELDAAREAGGCRIVTLLGDPGIGKTRLARELAATAGVTAVRARCPHHGAGGALRPLLDALPEPPLRDEPDGELVQARLEAAATGAAPLGESFWAIRRALEALAVPQPLLVLLDDAHWAEPALLDLVDYLGDRVERPLLVLCLARPELGRPPGDPLPLGPLSDDDSRAVAAGVAELDEATREKVVAAAEGNPLHLEQLASFAAEGGEGLPPTLEAVLSGRLGRLDAAARGVLQRAAILGREFALGALADLTGGDVTRDVLALARAGFLHPSRSTDPGEDAFAFHHTLLRDAAYAALTKSDRAALHARAVAWIDRDGTGDDALAGYHLEQAARWRRELGEDAAEVAAAAGERLGEAAMRVWRTNDVSAAASLLARATVLLPPGRRRAELLWEQSIAERLHGLPAAANTTLDAAAADAREARAASVAARVEVERAQLELFGGRIGLDDALRRFDAALAILREQGDDRGVARAELCAGSVHALACNMAEVRASSIRGAESYARAGFSRAACVAQHAEALYYGAVPLRRAAAEAQALLDAAADRMTEAGVTTVLGGLHALGGDRDEADALLERAHGLYEDLGAARTLLTVWSPIRVWSDVAAGRLDAAIELATTTAAALRSEADRAYGSTHALIAAELLLRAGDEAEAARHAAVAAEDALPSDVLVQFWSRAVRARLLAREGDVEEAERVARDAVALSSLTDVLCDRARVHLALAEVLEAAGDAPEARRERRSAATLLRRKGVKGAPVGAPSR